MGELDRIALGDLAPAVRRIVQLPSPAAGADVRFAVPGDQVWRIYAITFTLITSAAVANRLVGLTVDDQTTVALGIGGALAQTAGQTIQYSFIAGLSGYPSTLSSLQAMPLGGPLTLGPGYRVSTVTSSIQAADQFSGVVAWVEQMAVGISALELARRGVEDVYDEPTAFL